MDELVTRHPGDIAQIRLPMVGNPMRYVNAYTFVEDDGLTLVDCGWKADDVLVALERGLAEIDASLADVKRMLVTHAHFDHYGLAATLRRMGVPTLYMHEADAHFAKILLTNPVATDTESDNWISRNGFTAIGSLEDDVHYNRTEYAEPTNMPADGDRVGRLRVVHTPGHTPGHLCFVDEQTGVMLTGDHVLTARDAARRHVVSADARSARRLRRVVAKGSRDGRDACVARARRNRSTTSDCARRNSSSITTCANVRSSSHSKAK